MHLALMLVHSPQFLFTLPNMLIISDIILLSSKLNRLALFNPFFRSLD